MSIRNTNTKVYLYLNDYNAVCGEIYRHERIETGGNLFGLWTTEGNVVVHVPLGPGKNCKRTNVSFHQEIAYLSRVGSFLNKKFMLCHIGEWHSHHRLSLNEPSSGDKRTIRDNYPNGVKKFLVIIGNIVGRDQVTLSPYFFSENGNTCEKGKVEVLDTDNPFTIDETILKEMNEGAETPRQPIQKPSPVNRVEATPTDRSGANDDTQESAMEICSNSDNPSPATVSQTSASHSPSLARGASPDNPSSTSEIIFPPEDYEKSPPAQTSPSNDNGKQTRQEINLKKIYDEIESKFPRAGIVMERTASSADIEMKFKHDSKYWLIRFPKNFPEKAATLYWSFDEKYSNVCQYRVSKPESLNNYISILLMIRQKCSSYCSICEKITVQSLVDADATLNLFLTEEGEAILKELLAKTETLADAGSLKQRIKHEAHRSMEPTLEVSFRHSLKIWTFKLSSTFPVTQAEITVQANGSYNKSVYLENAQYSNEKLDSTSNILLAVIKKCYCEKSCKRLALYNKQK